MIQYKIIIEPEAYKDLQNIFQYITEQDTKNKAFKFIEKLKKQIATLSTMPERCRKSIYIEDESVHDFIVSGYTIVFQLRSDTLHILTIFRQREY